MNKYILLFLLPALIQCNSKINNRAQIADFVLNYKLDTLQIRNGDTSPVSFLSHVMFDEDEVFVGIDPFQHLNTLFFFDFKKKKDLNTINVDLNITKTEVRLIGGVSSDSIFFASHQSSLIYLINKDGDILKYWDLEKTGPKDYINKHPFFISFFPDSRIIVDENHDFIFIPIIDDRFHELKGNEKIFHVLRVNIKTDEMEVIGFPVGKGKSRNGLFFPDDLSFPQIESIGKELYLTYPFDENIHVFSIDGAFLKSLEMSFGSNDIKMSDPMTLDTKKNREKAREYRIKMPFFESLKYHKDLGLFSRIYHQPSSPDLNQKGRSTVYFWDENFNFKGDVNFGYNEIMAFRSIKTSKGYIFASEVDNEDYLAHRLKFEIK
jgi:hypothetical protein